MDKYYMLDDYILDQDHDLKEKEEASTNLDKLEFRINGSKTIDEIKKQVSIFLEKNSVSPETEEELLKICSEFNENTDVYKAITYLEDFMKEELEKKEKNYQDSSDTVQEIKQDVVNTARRDLDNVGITMIGNTDTLVDEIENEYDVYKFRDNVKNTTEYFEERKDIINSENKTIVDLNTTEISGVLETSDNEHLLNNILEQEQKDISNESQVEFNDDGSIIVKGDVNDDQSMNFAAMMTTVLVTSNDNLDFDPKLDMKFIKDSDKETTFKIVYGDFPLSSKLNNSVDPHIINKVSEIVNSYQSGVSYMELLGKKSPELMTSLILIQEQILNKNGAFQMAVKNGGNIHEMIFAVDENYADVVSAFSESGAMVTHDVMEHGIIRVNNTMPGEQLLILDTTLNNLRQRKKDAAENELVNQHVYQKKLVFHEQMNESANVHRTFLIVCLVVQLLLVLFGAYLIFV